MSSLQEVLPPSQRIDPVPPTHVYLTSELSSKLPKEYAAYSANLTRMTRADLCSMGLIKETLYRWMDCEAVIGGIIRNGFP